MILLVRANIKKIVHFDDECEFVEENFVRSTQSIRTAIENVQHKYVASTRKL